MHSNVGEWCADWYAEDNYTKPSNAREPRATGPRKETNRSPVTASENPSGPESGSDRVVRGGSWIENAADYCRSACRGRGLSSYRRYDLGFRLSRVV